MRDLPVAVALWVAAALPLAPAQAQVSPDTLVVPDSTLLVVAPDSSGPALVGDTVPDSLRVHRLPELEDAVPSGFPTGVWVFDREDLLSMRGLSLADLLAEVPGVIRLRGGDYGAPQAVTAFGLAGGRIRIFWDGFEQIPLDGAVPDLARIGLGGVEGVRVERHPGELRVELASLRDRDPRPYSLVEAGTGDLDTNFFRGTFVHPRALGGSLALSLDRVDTDGPRGAGEKGNRVGGWLRYSRFWADDDVAVTLEARRMRTSVDVPEYPGEGTRLDWVARARWRAAEGLVLQGYTGGSTLEGLEEGERFPVDRSRRQHGLVAGFSRGPLALEGALRLFSGPHVPANAIELSAALARPELGGVSADVSSASWGEDRPSAVRLGAWSRPVAGVLSLFGSWERGTRGVALYPRPPEPVDPPAVFDPDPDPSYRMDQRSALRVGATVAWRGLHLSAARVTLDTDSLGLLGLPMDRDGMVLPGVERTGFELAGRTALPLFPDGFALTGALTTWDAGARYLPERAYRAALAFHDVFLETGNLELWGSLGVEGRDPMLVPLEDPSAPAPEGEAPVPVTVPFYQSWHAFVQVRVLTVRLFVGWENFTIRRNNQDFPGRLLPISRSTYGVRWTLWN